MSFMRRKDGTIYEMPTVVSVLTEPSEASPGIVLLSCGHHEHVHVPIGFDGQLEGGELRCRTCREGPPIIDPR